jgi:hypothetical protein
MAFETLYIKKEGGGSYPSSGTDRFSNGPYGDIGLYIKCTKFKIKGEDKHLSITVPETSYTTKPQEIEGGFKRTNTIVQIEGLLDYYGAGDTTVATKKAYLWNIFEYGDPKYTFINYRGKWIFSGTPSGANGKCKIETLDMDDDATVSEPSSKTDSVTPVPTSAPKRVKVVMTIKYVDPS